MGINSRVILGFAVLIMLFGLGAAYFNAGNMPRLFVAVPISGGTSISGHAAESLNDNRFVIADETGSFFAGDSLVLLTYENRQIANVSALNVNHNAVLIGTNHSYPFVLGKQLTHGRFFGRDAFTHGYASAVLNETAAFEFFGTIHAGGNRMYINGTAYSVVGVIADGDTENAVIYAPAGRVGGQIESIAANLDFHSEEHILNQWRQIGITGTHYNFINFDIARHMIQDRFLLALTALGIFVLMLAASKTAKFSIRELRGLQALGKKSYVKEAIKSGGSKSIAKILLSFTGMVVFAGLILLLGLNALDRVLIAYHNIGMLSQIRTDSFSVSIAEISRWNNISNMFFTGFWLFFIPYSVKVFMKV